MKSAVIRITLGLALLGGLPAPLVSAEGAKTLPTLLIKGEVVSLDSSDAAAPLLKVKDRYGFETPIYLMATTKIAQGETALDASTLTSGATVEVEYNFDVNTAKRHAVSVKLPMPPPAMPPAPATVPVKTSAAAPAQAPDETPASTEEQAPAKESAPDAEQVPDAQ